MRPACSFARYFIRKSIHRFQRRNLLTLAIETSCDDTSVAILEKHQNGAASLHFHSKITSDNRSYKGVHPLVAHESHQQVLASLINEALRSLPISTTSAAPEHTVFVRNQHGGETKRKPDFITVTRGPGMRAGLITGVDTAKGLAVAWQIPFLGVNHMAAHAITPRMVSALEFESKESSDTLEATPAFPFLSLLVSGGHTMLVHSRGLCDHEILANTMDIAIGDMIDKSSLQILPANIIENAGSVSYGPLLEQYAFSNLGSENESESAGSENGLQSSIENPSWTFKKPLMNPGPEGLKVFEGAFSFSGTGSQAQRFMAQNPEMPHSERRLLAREVMRIAFEHLASRVITALKRDGMERIKTLVVSGGVASNQFLKQVIRKTLDSNGHKEKRLVFPPVKFCTDNAAMIAWVGIEMWEAGYRTHWDAMALRKWAIDPRADDGGILGVGGWDTNCKIL